MPRRRKRITYIVIYPKNLLGFLFKYAHMEVLQTVQSVQVISVTGLFRERQAHLYTWRRDGVVSLRSAEITICFEATKQRTNDDDKLSDDGVDDHRYITTTMTTAAATPPAIKHRSGPTRSRSPHRRFGPGAFRTTQRQRWPPRCSRSCRRPGRLSRHRSSSRGAPVAVRPDRRTDEAQTGPVRHLLERALRPVAWRPAVLTGKPLGCFGRDQ